MQDEPAGALDLLTENIVLGRIAGAFPDTCLLVSVHRMSLLHHFNRIVLITIGRVQDAETVDELLERQAVFRQMLKLPGAPSSDASSAAVTSPG